MIRARYLVVMAAMSVIAAFILAGCAKQEESTAPMKPMGSGTANSGGMMMSGDAKKDRPMMDAMMMEELGQSDASYDDRFISLMIPHHEAAIMMAKDALEKATRPELKQMARDIIASQQKEIAQMKAWQKKWYGH
ncbi:MAG: DUF305 domain-containing protein [Armatimonadota bacterium]